MSRWDGVLLLLRSTARVREEGTASLGQEAETPLPALRPPVTGEVQHAQSPPGNTACACRTQSTSASRQRSRLSRQHPSDRLGKPSRLSPVCELPGKNIWLRGFEGWTCLAGVGESDVNPEQKPEQQGEEARH